jgi:oligopeptide transport system ATP-binding protein
MYNDRLLTVNDLRISFSTYAGEVEAVRSVSFDLRKGETLAIVGESGSGKTVTAKSLMRLLPEANTLIKGGEAIFEGQDLLKLSDKQMQKVRGSKIAMVFQDPMTSLDPTMKVGKQIEESLKKHLGLSGQRARERAIELLTLVGIPNPEGRVRQYPHQFSGGMRQRVVIAIAIACNPQILIADEPTIADRVAVMYAGKVVETGTLREVFYDPQMPYTWGLLASIPLPTADRSQELIPIPGSPPDMSDAPTGCPFTARCPYAMRICSEEMPEYTTFSPQHKAACWLHHPMAPNVEPPVRVRGTG